MRGHVLLFAIATLDAQPVRTGWIRSTGTAPVRPEVHSVEFVDGQAVVRSNGISLGWLGPLVVNPRPSAGPREYRFAIPLSPQRETGAHAHVPSDYSGVFLNGVPIYNQIEASSYRGQNLWHFDPLANAREKAPGLLEGLLPNRGGHSPVIGYALDGYPVYGPWSSLGRMRSSYQLRNAAKRDRLPDGTRLAPGQEGPEISAAYPAGTFAEDYEYIPGSGDLDRFNGRFMKTPEYPDGTYAYFLSTNDAGQFAFPYLLAYEFYGQYGQASPFRPQASSNGISLQQAPGVLRFHADAGRILEHVHEKPMHVFVISEDRKDFAHIHPEVDAYGVWEALYRFPRAGRYRIFVDYTPPGSNPRMAQFDAVAAEGAAPHTRETSEIATMRNRWAATGEDVELSFDVSPDITNWQPYLGEWAHVLIAGERLSSLTHAHPAAAGGTHEHAAAPPGTIRVVTNFAEPGAYKIWLQLQVNGHVETVPFLLPVQRGKSDTSETASADIEITAHGYEPARLEIPSNTPMRLAFRRTTAANCGGRIVFPSLSLERTLAPGAVTYLDLPPQSEGELRFTCGMGMYRGSIVAITAPAAPALQKTDSVSGTPAPRRSGSPARYPAAR